MIVARKLIGIGAHVSLFAAAAIIFSLGLGVGLALNPTLGTFLWIAALAVAGVNIFWMIRRPLWR